MINDYYSLGLDLQGNNSLLQSTLPYSIAVQPQATQFTPMAC